MRHGAICTDCLDRRSVGHIYATAVTAIAASRPAPLAAGIALHRMRDTWNKDVDAFIVFSEFQRDKMIAAGLPAERIHMKPNFYDSYFRYPVGQSLPRYRLCRSPDPRKRRAQPDRRNGATGALVHRD